MTMINLTHEFRGSSLGFEKMNIESYKEDLARLNSMIEELGDKEETMEKPKNNRTDSRNKRKRNHGNSRYIEIRIEGILKDFSEESWKYEPEIYWFETLEAAERIRKYVAFRGIGVPHTTLLRDFKTVKLRILNPKITKNDLVEELKIVFPDYEFV